MKERNYYKESYKLQEKQNQIWVDWFHAIRLALTKNKEWEAHTLSSGSSTNYALSEDITVYLSVKAGSYIVYFTVFETAKADRDGQQRIDVPTDWSLYDLINILE